MSTCPDTLEFQRWLHIQCSELGLTRTELSRQLGVTRASIKTWWSGEAKPHTQNIFKIIQAFEILGGHPIDRTALPFHVSSCETPSGNGIGRWIVVQLNKRRISLWQLSRRLEIQDETMRQWILGNVQPNLLNMMRIIEFFSDGDPSPLLLEAYEAVLEDDDAG